MMLLSGFEQKFQNIFGFSLTEGKQFLVRSGTNIIFAIIILVIGWSLAKWAGKMVLRVLTRSRTDAGLITFLSSLTMISLKMLVVVTAITQLGVQMTSFVAILGAAGLAIGMAFSGTLSNFAGGVMILLFKPFKVGDTILTQGQMGDVTEIQIFYTYLHTADNKVIVVPNGPIANGNITNFTKAKERRVEWSIPISYGDDYVKAHTLIERYLQEDSRVLKDPAPFIALGSLGTSVMITVRAWTKTDEYWPVHFDLNKRIYEEFDKNGLNLSPPEPPAVSGSSPTPRA